MDSIEELGEAPDVSEMFHETQRRAYCAVHAANNAIGEAKFSADDFNDIANSLAPNSWINPHKTLFVGNYDINVLLMALELGANRLVRWHDRRLPLPSFDRTLPTQIPANQAADSLDENQYRIDAIIVNVPKRRWLNFLGMGRHWIAIVRDSKDDRMWYNKDSTLERPVLIGDKVALRSFLEGLEAELGENLHILLISGEKEQEKEEGAA